MCVCARVYIYIYIYIIYIIIFLFSFFLPCWLLSVTAKEDQRRSPSVIRVAASHSKLSVSIRKRRRRARTDRFRRSSHCSRSLERLLRCRGSRLYMRVRIFGVLLRTPIGGHNSRRVQSNPLMHLPRASAVASLPFPLEMNRCTPAHSSYLRRDLGARQHHLITFSGSTVVRVTCFRIMIAYSTMMLEERVVPNVDQPRPRN